MNLAFTGRGAMLYTKEGNTAAFFEDENNFFLIDCGEDVAHKLIKNNKLNPNKNYYLFITHTHSDHIGSIGTLSAYLYYKFGKILNIIYDENVEYLDEIKNILKNQHIRHCDYKYINIIDSIETKLFKSIKYIKTDHGDKNIKSCGLVIDGEYGKILYTGDNKSEQVIIDFIKENNDIDKIYVDTSNSENPVHLDFATLKNIIPTNLKDKVYCMHINDIELLKEVKENGFHFVTKLNDLDKMDILEILSRYEINPNEYKILSGASLVLQDVKSNTHDIDIAVSEKLFNELLQKYNCRYEKTNPNGTKVYMIDDALNFSTNYYETIETTKSNGYNIQTLESIKKLKKELNRPKDKYDIFLIDEKLKENILK